MIEVCIPSTLRSYCGCDEELRVDASNVREALERLEKDQTSLYRSVCDETGSVRKHIHLFINSDRVPLSNRSGFEMPLKSGDVLTIWTAVSGG